MSSPIDPVRRAAQLRRAQRSAGAAGRSADRSADRSVPVVYEPPPPPAAELPIDPAAAFNAHLMGQDGQKRGLRGGPAVLDKAKATYNKIEWSGPADRRARKGGAAKTEV
jgi:hypothetical protein